MFSASAGAAASAPSVAPWLEISAPPPQADSQVDAVAAAPLSAMRRDSLGMRTFVNVVRCRTPPAAGLAATEWHT
jgi:hypothetical protein